MQKNTRSSGLSQLKHVISYYAFILVVWGFFRALVKLPEHVEELVLKPLIWLIPLFIIIKQEKLGLESLGWTFKGLFKSLFYIVMGSGLIYLSAVLTLGLFFGDDLSKINIFSLWAEKKELLLASFTISVATAIVEETVFVGFIFNRLNKILENEFLANIINSLAWVGIHMPILIFIHHLSIENLLLKGVLSAIFSLGSAYLFARTGNIAPSIFLHVFWPWFLILLK